MLGFFAKSFDHQFMVVALWKSGYGHRTYNACVLDANRKAATVRCIIGQRQTVFFQQIGLLLSQIQAHCIRTAKEVGDDVALSPHPFGVVPSSAQ